MAYDDYPVNRIDFEYDSLEEAFPEVDCQHVPVGEFVVVQIRAPKKRTKGGLLLTDDSKLAEQDNTQVAKVIAVGPAAFKHRVTGEEWHGGPWYAVGDFVRCPKYGGDRWMVPHKPGKKSEQKSRGGIIIPAADEGDTVNVTFALFADKDIRMKVSGDPLKVRSFY